jgi:hypothetical protein
MHSLQVHLKKKKKLQIRHKMSVEYVTHEAVICIF